MPTAEISDEQRFQQEVRRRLRVEAELRSGGLSRELKEEAEENGHGMWSVQRRGLCSGWIRGAHHPLLHPWTDRRPQR